MQLFSLLQCSSKHRISKETARHSATAGAAGTVLVITRLPAHWPLCIVWEQLMLGGQPTSSVFTLLNVFTFQFGNLSIFICKKPNIQFLAAGKVYQCSICCIFFGILRNWNKNRDSTNNHLYPIFHVIIH